MKKILLFIFSISTILNITAQNSNLTIFSEDGNPFYVILNGIRQNEQPETNVRVNDLVNEYYSAKIIFGDQNLKTIEKKVLMVVDADANKGEVTYKVKRNKKGELVLRYFSFTPAAKVLPPPPSVAVVHYNSAPMPAISFGTNISTTTTSVSTSTNINNNPENVSAQINLGGMNVGASIQVNDNYNSGSTISSTTTTTTTNHNHINEPAQIYVEEDACIPMNSNTFSSAKNSIEDQSFSDSKLSQAKTIAASNCLSSMQIKEICNIFDFEDTKLQFAKYAYDFCFDRNNYWQVNEVFDFNSTTEELNDFIKKR